MRLLAGVQCGARGRERHKASCSRRQTAWFCKREFLVEINLSCRAVTGYARAMGLLEILIIILVLAAIFGGIAVSPVLFVLLIVVLVILFTRGGFGYQRGSRG